ncbi:MAG: PhzF family phenazine biosynthesis protein [Treponema sp.]|nr:PhzF family phenazine biosynthesis protein [Candidatus Treponema equifaecale]
MLLPIACSVESWPDDSLMLNIAKENNFSETAFTKENQDGTFDLRWFTPSGEIDFCGHATLATAFVIFNYLKVEINEIVFHTRFKGNFTATKSEKGISMDFPKFALNRIEVNQEMENAFGIRPVEAYKDRDVLCVFDDEKLIHEMRPGREDLLKIGGMCVAITAQCSGKYDCVSRVFAPDIDLYEDPVTGSTHCMIAPYWSQRLGKKEIDAFQDSARGGELFCRVEKDRVIISGNAVLFSRSELAIR